MPIIFVHGVNTRKGAAYNAGVKVKEHLLKGCFKGAQINGKTCGDSTTIAFPYWGDLGVKFAWDMASLPHGAMQALGAPVDPDYRALLAHVRDAIPGGMTAEPLLALARQDFANAVELLAAMALDNPPADREAETARFVVAAQEYAADHPQPDWLAHIGNDQQLLDRLVNTVSPAAGVEPLGIGDFLNALSTMAAKLKQAALDVVGTAVDRVGDFASSKLLSWTRAPLNATLGRFFGDVFIYFDSRGHADDPGAIPKCILDAVDRALQDAPPNEPLVLVGHSLGGVIIYDLLSYFRPELQVDLFVSVGSQVSHFEEMKLYRASDSGIRKPQHVPTPANIVHWINVYDEVDIFSYSVESIFDRVDRDARYDTKTYVIKAHGAYFDQVRFYKRLRARIDELR